MLKWHLLLNFYKNYTINSFLVQLLSIWILFCQVGTVEVKILSSKTVCAAECFASSDFSVYKKEDEFSFTRKAMMGDVIYSQTNFLR